MSKVLLSVHVLAAIVFVGPVTVAVSLFPRYAREALVVPAHAGQGVRGRHDSSSAVVLLHRVSCVYAVLGLSVPVLGIALGSRLGVLGDVWLLASVLLTVAAALLLALVILPSQTRVMELIGDTAGAASWAGASRLGMASGVFSLLWAAVVVLMVVRPGSTTGV